MSSSAHLMCVRVSLTREKELLRVRLTFVKQLLCYTGIGIHTLFIVFIQKIIEMSLQSRLNCTFVREKRTTVIPPLLNGTGH